MPAMSIVGTIRFPQAMKMSCEEVAVRVGISEDGSLRSMTIAGTRLPGLSLGERPEQMSCGDRRDRCPSSRPTRRVWERELDSCAPPLGAWQDCIRTWAVTRTCDAMPATSRTRRRQAARETAQGHIFSSPSSCQGL